MAVLSAFFVGLLFENNLLIIPFDLAEWEGHHGIGKMNGGVCRAMTLVVAAAAAAAAGCSEVFLLYSSNHPHEEDMGWRQGIAWQEPA